MKSLIETYRGWEVFFDTENETFYSVSDDYDKDVTKKSYPSVKKYIDDFIKENSVFKPFYVVKISGYYGLTASKERLKIIGIRKDNRFIYENSKGEKQQFSEYEEKDYVIESEENVSFLNKLKEENDKFKIVKNLYDQEVESLNEKLDKFRIKNLKQNYIQK